MNASAVATSSAGLRRCVRSARPPSSSHVAPAARPVRVRRVPAVTVTAVSTAAEDFKTLSLRRRSGSRGPVGKVSDAQATILQALSGVKGRGKSGLSEEQRAAINAAVELLEADGGVAKPTRDEQLLDGRWRLLFTSRPGTASPIQNTFTGVEAFSVFQDVQLRDEQPRIDNVVDFGPDVGYLRVEALASTDKKPLEGFTPRKGAGLPLFGKSFVYPPVRPDVRIDFQFDKAAFYFKKIPFTIPYPVPFRLLGDETKGWLDVTYISRDGNFRLSRGNKGTLFVLVREGQVKQKLLAAVAAKNDDAVNNLLQFMALDNPTSTPAKSPLLPGNWRLVWSQQSESASALQKWGTKQAESFQVIDAKNGVLQNIVQVLGGALEVRAVAKCEAASDIRTEVYDAEVAFSIFGKKLQIANQRTQNDRGFVEYLYLDEDMRITRGNKGSLFIHTRESDESS